MIGTASIKCNAAHPNMPLNTMFAFKGSPSSIRLMDVPKKIGNWNIENVLIQVTYPDNKIVTKSCVKTGALWIGTFDGCDTVGKVSNGFKVIASGKDENDSPVDGYIIGVGDVIVLAMDGSITPEITGWNVRIFDEQPNTPHTGDAYFDNENLKIFDNGTWKSVVEYVQRAEYSEYSATSNYAYEAEHASSADNADYANKADSANTADSATTAMNANQASYASQAEYAQRCDYADTADSATTSMNANQASYASYAENASYDASGNEITSTYATKAELNEAIGQVLTQEEF